MRKQTGIRLPDLAQRQLEALCKATGMNQSAVMVTAIDRMFQQENRQNSAAEAEDYRDGVFDEACSTPWSGLSEKAQSWRIGLDRNRWKYGQVPRPIRLELFRCVCASLEAQIGRPPIQSEFDAARPGWMSGSTSHIKTLGHSWTELIDRTKEIVPEPQP